MSSFRVWHVLQVIQPVAVGVEAWTGVGSFAKGNAGAGGRVETELVGWEAASLGAGRDKSGACGRFTGFLAFVRLKPQSAQNIRSAWFSRPQRSHRTLFRERVCEHSVKISSFTSEQVAKELQG
jgi:hypothetical protein